MRTNIAADQMQLITGTVANKNNQVYFGFGRT